MTKQEMIDVIVTGLMLDKNTREKDRAIELMLRNGWKGYNNFTEAELEQELKDVRQESIKFLLLCNDLLSSIQADENRKKSV